MRSVPVHSRKATLTNTGTIQAVVKPSTHFFPSTSVRALLNFSLEMLISASTHNSFLSIPAIPVSGAAELRKRRALNESQKWSSTSLMREGQQNQYWKFTVCNCAYPSLDVPWEEGPHTWDEGYSGTKVSQSGYWNKTVTIHTQKDSKNMIIKTLIPRIIIRLSYLTKREQWETSLFR